MRDLSNAVASGKVRAIGLTWYREHDYKAVLAIMADANVLPRTYAAWLEKFDKREQECLAIGLTVIKAVIDPNTFPEWCINRGYKIDAQARTVYSAEYAARHTGQVGI